MPRRPSPARRSFSRLPRLGAATFAVAAAMGVGASLEPALGAGPNPPSEEKSDAAAASQQTANNDEPGSDEPGRDEPKSDKPKSDQPGPAADGWRELFGGRTLDGWETRGMWAAADGEVFASPSSEPESDKKAGEKSEGKDARAGSERGATGGQLFKQLRAELAWTGEDLPEHCEIAFEFAATPAAHVKVRVGGKGEGRGFVYVEFPDPDRKPDYWGAVSSYQPGREPRYRRFNLTQSATAARIARYQAVRRDGTTWHRVRLRIVDGEASLIVNGVDLGGGRDADLTDWTRDLFLIVDRPAGVAGPAWVRFRSLRVRPLNPDGRPAAPAEGAAAAD